MASQSTARSTLRLPLDEVPPDFSPRAPVILGVGPAGRRILAHTRYLPAVSGVMLTDESTAADRYRALRLLLRRPSNEPGLVVNLVVVGAADELLEEWDTIQSSFEQSEHTTRLRTLAVQVDLGEAPAEAPTGCAGWFRLARDYRSHSIDRGQLEMLAAHLLASGGCELLLQFAGRYLPTMPVQVGVAAGWLPAGRVLEAVADCLSAQLADRVRQPAVTATQFTLHTSLPDLESRLRNWLTSLTSRHVQHLQQQLRRDPRLDLENLAAPESLAQFVNGWCQQQAPQLAQVAARHLREPHQLSGVAEGLAELQQTLRAVDGGLLENENRLRDAIQQLAEDIRKGAQRLRDCRASWSPVRRLQAVSYGIRWKATLARLVKLKREQWVAGGLRMAIAQWTTSAAGLQERLREFYRRGIGEGQRFHRWLEPDHPGLLPLHQPDVLRRLIESLVSSARDPRDATSCDRSVWAAALERLFAGDDDPWPGARRVGRRIARCHRLANQPLFQVAFQLTPQYREATLRRLLLQLAEPHAERAGADHRVVKCLVHLDGCLPLGLLILSGG